MKNKYIYIFNEQNNYLVSWKEPNTFQYNFVTVHLFWFSIIRKILAQLATSERKRKRIIYVKIHIK